MKFKNLFSLLALLMILFSSLSVFAADPESASFDLVLLSYEPSPAEPGSYIDVKIKATNIGKTPASNAKFELIQDYPFSLDPGDEPIKTFGTVGSKQDVILTYTVRVDAKAAFGTTDFKIKSTTDGYTWLSSTLSLDVGTTDAILSLSEINAPELLVPGEIANIDITLTNLAESLLKDVSLKLDLEEQTGIGATGVYSIDLPFIPIGSGMEQKVKYMSAAEDKTFSFKLRTYADAESKIYKIPVVITYKDEGSTEYTINEILGVVVGAVPSLSIEVDELSLKSVNSENGLTLRIVNKGLTNVQFLTAYSENNDNYELKKGSESTYVGGVDSDDYETVDFTLTPKVENFDFIVKLDYKDANNRKYQEEIAIPIHVNSSNGNSDFKITPVQIFVVLGVIILVVLLIRKSKKKKH